MPSYTKIDINLHVFMLNHVSQFEMHLIWAKWINIRRKIVIYS
jgi:hypothetical protein